MLKALIALLFLAVAISAAPEYKFESPELLKADNVLIGSTSDLNRSGALCPLVYDWDGDGDDDLLVGTFYPTAGVMFFENTGVNSENKPILTKTGWLEADGAPINIPKY